MKEIALSGMSTIFRNFKMHAPMYIIWSLTKTDDDTK